MRTENRAYGGRARNVVRQNEEAALSRDDSKAITLAKTVIIILRLVRI